MIEIPRLPSFVRGFPCSKSVPDLFLIISLRLPNVVFAVEGKQTVLPRPASENNYPTQSASVKHAVKKGLCGATAIPAFPPRNRPTLRSG